MHPDLPRKYKHKEAYCGNCTNNTYLPIQAVIEKIIVESADAKTFILRPVDRSNQILKYKPGQFMILSLAGYGEAPFTFASSPGKDGSFQISV